MATRTTLPYSPTVVSGEHYEKYAQEKEDYKTNWDAMIARYKADPVRCNLDIIDVFFK